MTYPPFLIRKRIGTFVLILGASIVTTGTLRAQTTAGLIGTRHVEASVFFENIRQRGVDDGVGFGLRANFPLLAALDVTISGSQEEIDTNDFRERTALATLTAHASAKDFTPYFSVTLGQVWQSARVAEARFSESESLYAATLGFEAPVGDRTALDVHVTFADSFSGGFDSYWVYSAGLNHWFSGTLGATVAASVRDSSSTLISVGALLRF